MAFESTTIASEDRWLLTQWSLWNRCKQRRRSPVATDTKSRRKASATSQPWVALPLPNRTCSAQSLATRSSASPVSTTSSGWTHLVARSPASLYSWLTDSKRHTRNAKGRVRGAGRCPGSSGMFPTLAETIPADPPRVFSKRTRAESCNFVDFSAHLKKCQTLREVPTDASLDPADR